MFPPSLLQPEIVRKELWEREGYFIVPRLFSASECRGVLDHEIARAPKHFVTWHKERAARDPFYNKLVRDERFISILRSLLGQSIIAWGVDVIFRNAGAEHPWHSDIESCAAEGGFVSIWIGLAHTTSKSGLKLIAGSHLLGTTVQEQAFRHGFRRGQASDMQILDWARASNPAAHLSYPCLGNGDALVFNGRLWHGSSNQLKSHTRSSLLLQYARADCRVRMYDPNHLEWPLRYQSDEPPPIVMVSAPALYTPDPTASPSQEEGCNAP